MSDSVQASPPVTQGPSAGSLLREAREAAGLHVAALAVLMKVPVRKLEALEQDRVDLLSDAVFARALASSMCRTLKIDPQPVLDRLPQTKPPRLIQDREGLNEPFRPSTEVGGGQNWFEQLTKPVFLAVFALLLGALVLLLMPSAQKAESAAAPGEIVAPVPATLVPSVVENAAAPVVVSPAPGAVVPASLNSPTGVSPVSAKPVPAAPAPTPPAEAVAPGSGAASANGLVIFRASGPSWIEVTDARGNVTLRRLLAAGESAGASGTLPLAVTVGSANVTQVMVRGKPFSMASVSRDNVARFEVK